MNIEFSEGASRSDVLELWWLKARRATSGQNAAAVRAARLDRQFTSVNIFLPLLVLALSASGSISRLVDEVSSIQYQDLVIIGTACILAVSFWQMVGDFKGRAIEHRRASCEFDAIAQEIEAIRFCTDDDRLFDWISNRLEQVQQSSRHVPEEDWKKARAKYDSDIVALRNRIRERHQGQQEVIVTESVATVHRIA